MEGVRNRGLGVPIVPEVSNCSSRRHLVFRHDWNYWNARLRALLAYYLGAGHDRLDDFLVTRASADIAVHKMLQFVFRGIGILIQQRFGRENHSRSAKPALKPTVFDESFLQGMEFTIVGQSFDGHH